MTLTRARSCCDYCDEFLSNRQAEEASAPDEDSVSSRRANDEQYLSDHCRLSRDPGDYQTWNLLYAAQSVWRH
ncbi:hypothetical protein RRG08_031244 [Elysia crispata]|uniref:Uncharacterized protein n=1 Tax=Elysia crispata TaxID=231223 RepID=A0AAE1AJ38_9GAST|nr:hypothetical protein RRG08_031244 [Elysia crispata]